jgi:hypothetical protein
MLLITLLVIAIKPVLAVEEHYRYSNMMKVYAPEIVSIFEPYTIKVHIIDSEKAKDYDLIGIHGSCSIPSEYITGFTKPPFELFDTKHIKYNGEKELEIPLIQISHQGRVDTWGVLENGKNKVIFYDCTIRLKKSSNINDYSSELYVDFKPDFYKYSFGISDLPQGFNMLDPDKNTKEEIVTNLYKNYNKQSDNQKISLHMDLNGLDLIRGNTDFSYESLSSPSLDKFNLDQGDKIYEGINIGKEKAHIYYKCKNNGGSKYKPKCDFFGFIFKPFGMVEYSMDATLIEAIEDETFIFEEDWKRIFIDAIENTYFKSDGKNVDLIFEESEDDYCGDCKQGYVCGACGKCIKETKAIDISQTEISINLKIKNNGKKMLNSVDSNMALTVFPNIIITHDGSKVDYCNLKDPGIKMKIKGELLGNDTYSGFTSGFITDTREKTAICEINFKESNPKCVFIVSPSDRKKFIADAKEFVDEYKFTSSIENSVFNGERIEEKIAKIYLRPPKNMEIKLKSRTNQVQQGSTGTLEITPNGGTTEIIIVKVSLMGPGNIGLSSDKLNTNWLLRSVSRKETFKVGYIAPSMGNFDIGKELESLSMTKLQTDAAKQIALDAVTAYGGEYAGNIEALVEAGEYSAKIGHLTDTFKVVNGVRNIKGTEKSINDMTGELGDAMQVNDEKSEATWAENVADAGIVGISVAQTAVGVLTFIPNKIPGVSKLTSGLQTAFSAATNIWKANLQYISKSEKIERAKELYYPVVIVVTAQDLSGWTTQEMHVFQIAYHQVK